MYTAPPTMAVNAARPAASLHARKECHYNNNNRKTVRHQARSKRRLQARKDSTTRRTLQERGQAMHPFEYLAETETTQERQNLPCTSVAGQELNSVSIHRISRTIATFLAD